MLDLSLGVVDVLSYDGPLLEGKPLHSGSCEDSTYGCRRCNSAARTLTNEHLVAIGWPTTNNCDWCKKECPAQEVSGLRPYDEPSCYYEVCRTCRSKYNAELDELDELEDQDDDQSDYVCECKQDCDESQDLDGSFYKERCSTYLTVRGVCGYCKGGHKPAAHHVR
jgi:hypothetical protein